MRKDAHLAALDYQSRIVSPEMLAVVADPLSRRKGELSIDLQANYRTNVLVRLVAGHPPSRIDDLMPWTDATR